MNGRICIVTGANSGLGLVTATALVQLGAHVVMLCRNEQKGKAALAEVQAAALDGGSAELIRADLASLDSIRKFVQAFEARHDELHLLVNNAGLYLPTRSTSADGFESTFAINHLGPFLLTNLLMPRLRAGARAGAHARIVNVSSLGHLLGKVPFDDLGYERRYWGFGAYCDTKLMNILHARELARRHAPDHIDANALHPGAVATGFAQDEPGMMDSLMKRFGRYVLLTPEDGARTSIHLATSPDAEGITGKYWVRCKPAWCKPLARDDATAERLWSVSEDLCTKGRAVT